MSTSRLEALPAELLVLIAEYLFRRDLWASSVACKTLYAVITPLLYEKLYISSSRSLKLGQGLLNRKNPGQWSQYLWRSRGIDNMLTGISRPTMGA